MLRQVVLAAVLSLCAIAANAQSAVPISGKVFIDKNGNGLLDKGERGLAGVSISDGFNVVQTDGNGSFKLKPAPRARFVSVNTPDGYAHTNRFYRDIREERPALEFGLRKTEYHGRFIHMSDIESWEYKDWIDRIKEYVSVQKPDFLVETGDICYERGLVFYPKAMNDGNVGCRVVYTIGNHDLIKGFTDKQGNSYGEKMFEDNFGPSWYSFNVAGVHYIVTPMLAGDAKPSYSKDDIIAWIREELKYVPDGTPIILFNHNSASELLPEGENVRALVYGHRHFDLRSEDKNGIPYYCSASPSMGYNDHSGSALREFWIGSNGEIRTRMHFTPISNQVVAHETGGVVTSVVYDAASEAVKAEVVLPDGRKVAMKRQNDFMWSAGLKQPLPAGSKYKVRAHFSDGEIVVAPQVQEPGLRWMTTLPGKTAFSNPILSEGRLLIAGINNENDGGSAIYCLNASSGKMEWSCPVKNSVKGDMSLNKGIIYAADVECNVYAVNSTDGSVKWTVQVEHSKYPSFTEGVLVEDGLVYVGTGERLCAIDAETGGIVWNNGYKHNSITNVCTSRISDGALLTNGYWVGRFCYDAKTGAFLWEKKDKQNRYSTCTPAVLGDTFVYTGRKSISQVVAKTGEVLKYAEYPYFFDVRSEPLIVGDKLFVGTSDAGFISVDMNTLEKSWQFQCKPALIYTSPYSKNYEKTVEGSPVVFDDCVIFGANDGFLYCLKQKDGTFVWRINIGMPVISKPAIDGSRVFLTDFAGNVYCYSIDLFRNGILR